MKKKKRRIALATRAFSWVDDATLLEWNNVDFCFCQKKLKWYTLLSTVTFAPFILYLCVNKTNSFLKGIKILWSWKKFNNTWNCLSSTTLHTWVAICLAPSSVIHFWPCSLALLHKLVTTPESSTRLCVPAVGTCEGTEAGFWFVSWVSTRGAFLDSADSNISRRDTVVLSQHLYSKVSGKTVL